uniref:C3H1-type domain-containing protein n=1 Tax=Hyaloperonospora arabidopsidis (strain Emoy2) TaxID=559515 RepID=M4BHB1_HYAAE
MTSHESLQFLVHWNRTLSVSLSPSAATMDTIMSVVQQREGVPSSLLDLYVNGRKLEPTSPIPAFPTIIRARLRGGLRGGKGGFGAMLRSMGKSAGAKATTDFGACRDLHGRRLRHVNQEVAMRKWLEEKDARGEREKKQVDERELMDEETRSGIPGWYLATPSWAEGVKKSHMKRRRNTVLCKSWLKAREGGRRAPSGAPRWWGCPRGRDCDFAHGQEELRGEGLTELKRVKKEETERVQQLALQSYVDFEQDMPEDVLAAIKTGLGRRKTRSKVERQQKHARVLPPPDATTYISVRSVQRSLPVVEQWLKLVGEGSGGDVHAGVETTFKHGLCELRGRGNFGTASARHCCALTQGKWYYEVRLVTAGVVQIGWADSTFEANSESGDGVGDHERSWAYDGFRQVKWNNGKDEKYAADDVWSKNDVIGCLLDLDEGTVSFTRNGVDLGVAYRNVKHSSSDRGFFPAISVEQAEILLVNIGSQPFLYEAPGFEPVMDALDSDVTEDMSSVASNGAESATVLANDCESGSFVAEQSKETLTRSEE